MKIKVIFDCDSFVIFVPDGYVTNFKTLRDDFIQWAQSRPESICSPPNGKSGYCYTEELFLKYINSVILQESQEIAYLVNQNSASISKHNTITF